ncbi:unnamed protein product [Closterium sp. NIES-54]
MDKCIHPAMPVESLHGKHIGADCYHHHRPSFTHARPAPSPRARNTPRYRRPFAAPTCPPPSPPGCASRSTSPPPATSCCFPRAAPFPPPRIPARRTPANQARAMKHRRRATGAVLASAGGMAEHCGGAMEVGGGVDPRPWSFHRRHLLPVACALSPSPPLRLSASPPLLEHKSPSPPFRAPPPQAHHASPFAPTPHCHFTTLLAFLPSSFPHSSASPFAPPPPQQQATGGAGGAGRKLGGSGRWEAEREKGVGGEAAAEGWRGARRQGEQSAGRGRGAHCWGRGGWRGGVGGWDVRPAVPPGRCGVVRDRETTSALFSWCPHSSPSSAPPTSTNRSPSQPQPHSFPPTPFTAPSHVADTQEIAQLRRAVQGSPGDISLLFQRGAGIWENWRRGWGVIDGKGRRRELGGR